MQSLANKLKYILALRLIVIYTSNCFSKTEYLFKLIDKGSENLLQYHFRKYQNTKIILERGIKFSCIKRSKITRAFLQGWFYWGDTPLLTLAKGM